MVTLMKNRPRLELIARGPDGKMRVQYRISGPEWIFPDPSEMLEMWWGKWEKPQATVLLFENSNKKPSEP